MKAAAWPFLVSRNRDVDYRPIVIGRPMRDSRFAARIASHLDPEPSDEVRRTTLDDGEFGPVTLIYRVVVARGGDGAPRRDSFGRVIYRIEGLVVRAEHATLKDEDGVLRRVHEPLGERYEAFWRNGKEALALSDEVEVEIERRAAPSRDVGPRPALRLSVP